MKLRRIAGFTGRTLLIYAFLLAPWPGLMDSYDDSFRSVGNSLFGTSGSQGIIIRFERASPEDRAAKLSVKLVCGNLGTIEGTKRTGKKAKGRFLLFNTRYDAYLPTALVLSLTGATPTPAKRRLASLVLGFMLINVFLAAVVAIDLGYTFSDPTLAVVTSPLLVRVFTGLYDILRMTSGARIVAPILIWVIVAFRRDDWNVGSSLFASPVMPTPKGEEGASKASAQHRAPPPTHPMMVGKQGRPARKHQRRKKKK